MNIVIKGLLRNILNVGHIIERDLIPLSEMSLGAAGVLAALANSSQDLLHHLNESKIQLGTSIRLIKVERFDNTHIVMCDDRAELSVSEKLAGCLLMRL